MKQIEYKKIPWYWKCFSKFQKFWCFIGLHVPVEAYSPYTLSKKNDEYFCQFCMKELDKKRWQKFWKTQ